MILPVIVCEEPAAPNNGIIHIKNFTGIYQFGTVAVYQCNPGHVLDGDSRR